MYSALAVIGHVRVHLQQASMSFAGSLTLQASREFRGQDHITVAQIMEARKATIESLLPVVNQGKP